MLSRKFRLKRGQIKFLMKKGEEKQTGLFIIKVMDNKEEYSRFSVVVSRKIFPKAVPRNHLRRQIYETIRLNFPEKMKKDILLIPKKHIIDMKYQEIEKGVCEMLKSLSHG